MYDAIVGRCTLHIALSNYTTFLHDALCNLFTVRHLTKPFSGVGLWRAELLNELLYENC